MKERYENVEMDILELEAVEVINTSNAMWEPTESSHYNPNCENEGPAGDAFL